MGFINQFPYSDFHQLNLDWIIKINKQLADQVAYISEEFAKIQILTEDQINAMINSAIASNNIILYNKLTEMKNQITQEYQAFVMNQIDLQKVYIDNQDTYYHELAKAYSDNVLNQAKEYTDNKVLNYTMMVNPITGDYDDVRVVVNDIVYYFHTDNTLTAGEYDALNLTASAYDAYGLSAFDYDYNGKILLV